MTEDYKLSYLLSAKFCHDVAGPVGAMGFGIDMMDDPDINDTVRQSLDALTVKLKFYRSLLTPTDDAPHFGEIMQILKEWSHHCDVRLNFENVDENLFHGTHGRLLLGVGFMCIETLMKGGSIDIYYDSQELHFLAKGEKCQFRESYRDTFFHPNRCLEKQNARTILPYYMIHLAQSLKAKIHYDFKENESLSFTIGKLV